MRFRGGTVDNNVMHAKTSEATGQVFGGFFGVFLSCFVNSFSTLSFDQLVVNKKRCQEPN